MTNLPPPGSEAAIKLGCRCAIIDNNHGKGAYIVDGNPVYWISGDCELHTEDCGVDDCRLIKRVYHYGDDNEDTGIHIHTEA